MTHFHIKLDVKDGQVVLVNLVNSSEDI